MQASPLADKGMLPGAGKAIAQDTDPGSASFQTEQALSVTIKRGLCEGAFLSCEEQGQTFSPLMGDSMS